MRKTNTSAQILSAWADLALNGEVEVLIRAYVTTTTNRNWRMVDWLEDQAARARTSALGSLKRALQKHPEEIPGVLRDWLRGEGPAPCSVPAAEVALLRTLVGDAPAERSLYDPAPQADV